MNIAASADKTTAEQAAPRTDATSRFSEVDITTLKRELGAGLGGFARQGDIVELHKRIGEKFGKLPVELNLLLDQRDDPMPRLDAVEARLERIETTLDSLEGALRIELAPALGNALRESLPQPPGRRRGRLIGAFAILVAGLVAGSLLHSEISSAASAGWGRISEYYQTFSSN